jgi:hypothetical protein
LAHALRELPRGYRTIFLLHEVEGYEHQEIAEMLGCSVGNSKSQLHKAKLRIRQLLLRPQEVRSELVPAGHSAKQPRPEIARLAEKWALPLDQGLLDSVPATS